MKHWQAAVGLLFFLYSVSWAMTPVHVMIGPLGSGKSLIVNVLAGRNVSESRFDYDGVTTEFKLYETDDGKLTLGDMMGWGHNHATLSSDRIISGTTEALLDFVNLTLQRPLIGSLILFFDCSNGRVHDDTLLGIHTLGDLVKAFEVPVIALFNRCNDQACSQCKAHYSRYRSEIEPLVGPITPIYVEYKSSDRSFWNIDGLKLRQEIDRFVETHAPVHIPLPPNAEEVVKNKDPAFLVAETKRHGCRTLQEISKNLATRREINANEATTLQTMVTQTHKGVPQIISQTDCKFDVEDCKETVDYGKSGGWGISIGGYGFSIGGGRDIGQVLNKECVAKKEANNKICLEAIKEQQENLNRRFDESKQALLAQYEAQRDAIAREDEEIRAQEEALQKKLKKCDEILAKK